MPSIHISNIFACKHHTTPQHHTSTTPHKRMSQAGFKKLEQLLKQLLANEANLPDHALRSADGELVKHPKDKASSWYMQLVHNSFPNEQEYYGTKKNPKDCFALGTCLRHLFGRYITTLVQMKKITPSIMALQPYVNVHQSQYFSSVKDAMKKGTKKSDALLKLLDKTFVQSKEQKAAENELLPDNLDERLQNPLQFDLADVMKQIDEHKTTNDVGTLGIILEAALGTRSIDLLNDQVMEAKIKSIKTR